MKICLILVDGMRPDSLEKIDSAQKILESAQYTMNARTVFPSVTLPCHMSLFHSVDPQRHGTVTNIYAPQVRPINGLYEVLMQNGKECAIFYDWEEIRDVSRPNSMKTAEFLSGGKFGYDRTNDALALNLIDRLNNDNYDFSFLYMGLTDWAGHYYGWMSQEYLIAMEKAWDNITKIKNSLNDEYLIIVTADHGGHDRTHGEDISEDMTIPIIIFGNTNNINFNFDNATIKDIAPTVTRLLNIDSDPDWEGKILIVE